jgi:hypothetical protein
MLDGIWRENAAMTVRLTIATLLAVGALALGVGDAAAQNDRNPTENSPADRALQGARLDDIHLWMADSYATLTRLVVVTPDCAFRGGTSVNYRQNVNKLGFTQDLPLIGGFFAPTPRQGQLTQANQLGLAYVDNGTLFVDLRQTTAPANSDRSLLGSLTDGPAAARSVAFSPGGSTPAFIAFSVVNRNYQFQVPMTNFSAVAAGGTACAPGAMTRMPPLGAMFSQPVGTAHDLGGQLIVLIKPSIIAGY